tara:strand:- start:1329 stop:1874 length:546 start_codon:yes stop_codon:yes gene_type:complete
LRWWGKGHRNAVLLAKQFRLNKCANGTERKYKMSISTVSDFRFTEVAKLIRDGMRRKNLTPKAVARNLKCCESAVSHWNVGENLPLEKNRVRLCHILGIRMDTMLQAVANDKDAKRKFEADRAAPVVVVTEPNKFVCDSKVSEDDLLDLMMIAISILPLKDGERIVVKEVIKGLVAARVSQ